MALVMRLIMVVAFASLGLMVYGCTTTVKALSAGSPAEVTLEDIESGAVDGASYVILKDHVGIFPESVMLSDAVGMDVDYIIYPAISKKLAYQLLRSMAPNNGDLNEIPEGFDFQFGLEYDERTIAAAVQAAKVFIKTSEYKSVIEIPPFVTAHPGIEGTVVDVDSSSSDMRMFKQGANGRDNFDGAILVDGTDHPTLAKGLGMLLGGAAILAIAGFLIYKKGISDDDD